LHAESSAFPTPNLQPFTRRIFDPFCTTYYQPFYTGIFCHFAPRTAYFLHPEPLVFAPITTTTTYDDYHDIPRLPQHTTYYHDYHNIPPTGYQVLPTRTNEEATRLLRPKTRKTTPAFCTPNLQHFAPRIFYRLATYHDYHNIPTIERDIAIDLVPGQLLSFIHASLPSPNRSPIRFTAMVANPLREAARTPFSTSYHVARSCDLRKGVQPPLRRPRPRYHVYVHTTTSTRATPDMRLHNPRRRGRRRE
jgi:hypothetical protein